MNKVETVSNLLLDNAYAAAKPLHCTVREALETYLQELDGELPENLYEVVINEVERPLLQTVMDFCGGNQTRAATMLGINRGTLRKKLRLHKLD